MSLDVYLIPDKKIKKKCECCGSIYESDEPLYSANITHDLGEMAGEAGIYDHLWGAEDIGIKTAKELIEPLKQGLQKLKDDPEYFKQFDASNGWGVYKDFVPFVEEYLKACIENPDTLVKVSR